MRIKWLSAQDWGDSLDCDTILHRLVVTHYQPSIPGFWEDTALLQEIPATLRMGQISLARGNKD